jgi:purine nucleosidase
MIIDQDCAGPPRDEHAGGARNRQFTEDGLLGITVVTSDAWRDKEVQHTLRLLEIIGRTDTPVVPGAVFPIANIHRDLRHLRWMSLWQSAQSVIRFSFVSSPSTLREQMW